MLVNVPLPTRFDPECLRAFEWSEGRRHIVALGPYGRHGNVILCTQFGSQKAIFADGKEHPYTAVLGLVAKDGGLNTYGGHVIPILPNGNVLMVHVPRPALLAIPRRRRTNIIEFLDGRESYDLGPIGEAEIPGGTVELGVTVKVGALLELLQELGLKVIENCEFITRNDLVGSLISEFAIQIGIHAIKLPANIGAEHLKYVRDDGGLYVLSLSQAEIKHNKRRGVFGTGSTHACLRFLADLNDPAEYEAMLAKGEITVTRETLRL